MSASMPGRCERTAGFTLVELLVGVAVMAVLLSIAVPSFENLVLSNRLRSYSNDLVASAQLAKSEAMKRRTPVTLCKSANGTSCASGGDWEQGWIVLAGSTVVRRAPAAASGYRVSSSTNSLTFQPSGVGSTQATLTVCRSAPVGSQERVVTISATGRTSVTRTQSGRCA